MFDRCVFRRRWKKYRKKQQFMRTMRVALCAPILIDAYDTLRNFPLRLNMIENFGVEVSELAKRNALGLAEMYWQAQVDGMNVPAHRNLVVVLNQVNYIFIHIRWQLP